MSRRSLQRGKVNAQVQEIRVGGDQHIVRIRVPAPSYANKEQRPRKTKPFSTRNAHRGSLFRFQWESRNQPTGKQRAERKRRAEFAPGTIGAVLVSLSEGRD